MPEHLISRIWWDDDPVPRLLRLLLQPAGLAYLGVMQLRNRLFDSGLLRVAKAKLPVVSVGNLTAGGTGKTPMSAWIANALRKRGASPAIIMRGYGNDESLVHRVLTPDTPVVLAGSRSAGVRRAAAEHGSDVAVLDDAFQHRWIHRDVDIVLLGAEETLRPRRGLPAGPWRESVTGLRRATLAIVTRKSASPEDAAECVRLVERIAPGLPVAVVFLSPGSLVRVHPGDLTRTDKRDPLEAMASETVLLIAAIGNPGAFVSQIERLAERVLPTVYPDHHAFSRADARVLVSRASFVDRVVCTLKDAVKLASVWPEDAPPLWYVSQEVIIERGADAIGKQLSALLDARPTDNETAGRRRPHTDIHGH